MDDVNSPERHSEIHQTIQRKKALKNLYSEVYQKYNQCLAKCPEDGIVIELGSGAGFTKEVLPNVVTTDVIAYANIDQVVDATHMPFENESLRAIFMNNVFHHISNVEKFLFEAQRCMKKGSRLLIVDQHPGFFSQYIYKYLHSETFDPKRKNWDFPSKGPLSDANGALAWIVFQRDREIFEQKYPRLKVVSYTPHTPLRYWLSGGLKNWSLLPGFLFDPATRLDKGLTSLSPALGSFVDIEIVKE